MNGATGNVLNVSDGDQAGRAVSAAGDVNGDGFDDLIIGAPFAINSSGTSQTGAGFVLFGGNFTNAVTHLGTANADSLKALVEFLAAQSGRTDHPVPFNKELIAAGREVFKGGPLKSGSLSSSCTDCHAMKALGDDESLGDGAGPGYPKLTGYAGRDWLKAFLRDPGHADFYGEKNTMMVFTEKRISDKELDLLVDWMVGDYYRAGKPHQ